MHSIDTDAQQPDTDTASAQDIRIHYMGISKVINILLKGTSMPCDNINCLLENFAKLRKLLRQYIRAFFNIGNKVLQRM